MDRDLESRIRERAYELWEEEGQPEGREEQHWEQACAEFSDARHQSAPPTRPKPMKAVGARTSGRKPKGSDAAEPSPKRAPRKRS